MLTLQRSNPASRYRMLASMTAILTLLGASCRDLDRVTACSELASTLNAGLGEIAKLDSDGSEAAAPDAYAQIATTYDELERQLGELELRGYSELEQVVGSLRGTLRISARESERYGRLLSELEDTPDGGLALDPGARQKLEQARNRMNKNLQTYSTASTRIEKLCAVR